MNIIILYAQKCKKVNKLIMIIIKKYNFLVKTLQNNKFTFD